MDIENDGTVQEAGLALYRVGDSVVAIGRFSGKRVVGSGESVQAALEHMFAEAFSGVQMRMAPTAAMSLPRKEDLPELPTLDLCQPEHRHDEGS